jgi:hypothetical protein
MAPIDPELELRTRRIAELRAAYEGSSNRADDPVETRTAQHSRVLLGRILRVLSSPHGGAVAPEGRTDGKACAGL